VRAKKIAFVSLVLVGAALIALVVAGSFLTAPAPQSIGELPNDLSGRSVQFASGSGASIHGWFIPGKQRSGAVVLMHGEPKDFGLFKVQNMSTCITQHLRNMSHACWNSFKRI